MLVESQLLNLMFDEREKEGFRDGNSGGKSLIWGLLGLIIMIIAGYLSWTCNLAEGTVLRVLYTILAVIFSGIYLLFYLIYHVILRNRCD